MTNYWFCFGACCANVSCISNLWPRCWSAWFHSSAFSKTSLNIWKFIVHVLVKPGLENFEHYFTICLIILYKFISYHCPPTSNPKHHASLYLSSVVLACGEIVKDLGTGCCHCLVTKSCSTLRSLDCRLQAPRIMEFPRQEYWSKLSFPSPGDLLDPRKEHASPALAGGFFTTELPGKSLQGLERWLKASQPPTKAMKLHFFLIYLLCSHL